MLWYAVLVLLATFYSHVDAQLDFSFKKYGMCEDNQDTPMKYWMTFTKINSSISLANGKAILPYDIGNDVTIDATIEVLKEDKWEELISLKNKPLCEILEKYGHDLWHEVEKNYFHKPEGACPITKGTYEVKDYVVDFSLLPIKTGPKAQLRAKALLMREGELTMCFYTEFELL